MILNIIITNLKVVTMVTKVSCASPGVPSHVSQTLLSATEPSPEDVALIAELHGLPSADLAPPLDLTPQRRKEKTFEALLRQVEGLVRQRPVLLLFDGYEVFGLLDAWMRQILIPAPRGQRVPLNVETIASRLCSPAKPLFGE